MISLKRHMVEKLAAVTWTIFIHSEWSHSQQRFKPNCLHGTGIQVYSLQSLQTRAGSIWMFSCHVDQDKLHSNNYAWINECRVCVCVCVCVETNHCPANDRNFGPSRGPRRPLDESWRSRARRSGRRPPRGPCPGNRNDPALRSKSGRCGPILTEPSLLSRSRADGQGLPGRMQISHALLPRLCT